MKKYVVAQNYMCFLALLEMIITDIYDTSIISQFDMADYFGLTIPTGTSLSIANHRFSTVDSEYGLHINANTLNDFFVKKNMKIKATYYKENPYEYNEIDSFSSKCLGPTKYLIYTFSYGYLFSDSSKINIGHAALYDSSVSETSIKIYDPGPLNPGL